MAMRNGVRLCAGFLSASALTFGSLISAYACSRVVHVSENGELIVTGRNMDWFEDTQSNLFVFPKGIKRNGAAGDNSAAWTSKYGSVATAGFDVSTADGLNEAGLMANLLYLGEADFGDRDVSRPGLSWSAWAQYFLDNFATVAEAVAAMKGDEIQIVASPLPGSVGKAPVLHVSISDATGDSAIFEYLEGKVVIHHGKQYKVMTNSPPFDQQLALNAYWESVGGDYMLPGTRRAADRFVRGTFYEKQLPNPTSARQALANVFSVMRNVSVPFGATDPNAPNLAPTIWRTAADQKSKIYFFESTLSPSIVWVDLNKLDFAKGAKVMKLMLVGNYDLAGDVSGEFVPSEAFQFAGPEN